SDELIDIFVIADNCTDNTAQIALDHGAFVIERSNKDLIGKGYALDLGTNVIFRECLGKRIGESICGQSDKATIIAPQGREVDSNAGYEAFFIFDADNVLDKNYFASMNKVYDSGYKVATSYRNTKNFDDN
ncbi:MAG: glycosyltransferase family 2 protein, partial [Clostridia bacterium]|nr:glycosyltransferase family 2 protein [Clostridia bacterium]